jgi:hypothetical protein
MGTKMTHTARAELTHVVRRRYCAATGIEKRMILDEFIAVTGYHEKSAIRALNAVPVTKIRQTRNRRSVHAATATTNQSRVWNNLANRRKYLVHRLLAKDFSGYENFPG